ncbi:MAG: RsmE family RNA methyltransferase, partial [Aquiluna sp.]
ELALQVSVELGCTSVVAWQAEHSVSRWTGKEDKNRERWQQIAIGAMKQSQQAFLPEVSGPLSTSSLRPLGHGIILDPTAKLSLAELDRESASYSIVVGPEGGISDFDQLQRAGFVSYRLGDAVMRTSTAGPAAIAALKTMRGLW